MNQDSLPDYSKRHLGLVVLILGFALAIFGAKALILGGSQTISLRAAPALSGVISQSLATNSSTLPSLNTDYKIKSVIYFDNKSWAIASVSVGSNSSLLVLEKTNGVYVVVLGPGTAFSTDEIQDLPPDVAQYITNQGVLIYTPED
jgi:hypothetical protein